MTLTMKTHILELSQARIGIFNTELWNSGDKIWISLLESKLHKVILIDKNLDSKILTFGTCPDRKFKRKNISYCMFSSGTTGRIECEFDSNLLNG